MPKSQGERYCTRYKLKKSVRERGISPVVRAIQEFSNGQMVHIDIDPSVHKGMPNPRFQGKVGKIVGQRGRAYKLNVKDGNSMKEIFCVPEHLKPQKYN
ncbi:50S ribosomal protein L21e [Methanosalsum natronophilum]|uniref:Large ribosomal subunit protein eL21 n=1 Tax=Methanosalsum natronophilum TaxID=768733 RepID=A0A3R7VTM3_9EURY|nr:50S ribosomal protein L21e [Methanosalsum natronophilum]MCS3924517.1 large subunit ribosomal protein L21e [Methanosalsum natronophilum]RQD86013.1 MAG: 50S ribosomal protein L21e [Methanosalsum natronophilum]